MLGLALLCMLLAVRSAAGATDVELEYKVKAGFLFNFMKFVEWPTTNRPAAGAAYSVAVFDDDPAGPVLAAALTGKMLGNHPVEVRLVHTIQEARQSHLLFLGRAEKERAFDVVEKIKESPVVTVGEMERFMERGGMINFVRQEETIHFEINLAAATDAHLQISSRLAALATVVKKKSKT